MIFIIGFLKRYALIARDRGEGASPLRPTNGMICSNIKKIDKKRVIFMSKIQEASNVTTTLLPHYQSNNNVITKKNSRPFPNTSSSVSFVGSIKSTQGKPSLFKRFQNLSKGWKIFWGSLGLLITGILPGILISAWICAAHKLSKPAPSKTLSPK